MIKDTSKGTWGGRHNWKGGRYQRKDGYIQIWIESDDFFFPMVLRRRTYGGYVLEHRLVMAKHLGRCLHPWEIVHHKNQLRDDNRIENLEILSDLGHKQLTKYERYVERLLNRIRALETEIRSYRNEKIPDKSRGEIAWKPMNYAGSI